MKASEYVRSKREAKRLVKMDRLDRYWTRHLKPGTWFYNPRKAPRLAVGSNGFIVSGTTADIDTPEKRHAIACSVLGLPADYAPESDS